MSGALDVEGVFNMAYSTFHNHTTFCDGKNTPEEMVLAAIGAGCKSIGFSGHAHTPFDTSYCMSKSGTAEYVREIRRLQEKYKQIRILCGIEQDFFSDAPKHDFDFIIGSVHYVRITDECGREKYLDVDDTKQEFTDNVQRYFNGNYYDFCDAYFAQVVRVVKKTHCTFVGHFDLVTKFNEGGCLFDTTSSRYRASALSALRELASAGATFEINTGAMARGYRKSPYPEPFILDEIARAGCNVVLSPDCHDATKLQFGLSEAHSLAISHGCNVLLEI